jgi:peptide subunit release factor 1 (eRF1)
MTWKQAEDKTSQEIRSELCELCSKMIDILGKAKENGRITENEYVEYIRLKKKILGIFLFSAIGEIGLFLYLLKVCVNQFI